jgi:hypothetical protein
LELVPTDPQDCLVYERRLGGERLRVGLNFGLQACAIDVPGGDARVLLSTTPGQNGRRIGGELLLGAQEGVILELLDRERGGDTSEGGP